MSSKTLKAYLFLRRKILDMVVAPGTELRVGQLEERLGMTRRPVTDALLWLQGEGYLFQDHSQLFQVKDWPIAEVRETYDVRALFSEQAAAALAEAGEGTGLGDLREAVERGRAALSVEQMDSEGATVSLRAFDVALVRRGAADLAFKLNRGISPPSQFRRTMRLLSREHFLEAQMARERLLRAVETRDARWAASVARCSMLTLKHRHIEGMETFGERYVDDWLDASNPPPLYDDVVWGDGFPDVDNSTLASLRPKPF